MRRFELKRGLSLRFWQVSVEGNHVTVTGGVAGTPAQPLTATFPTAEAAQVEQERLVKERISWGYVELDPGPVLPAGPLGAELSDDDDQFDTVRAKPELVAAPEAKEVEEVPVPAEKPDVSAARPPVRRAAGARRRTPSRRLMALPAQALAVTIGGSGTRRVRRDAMASLVAQKTPETPGWVATCLLDRDTVIRASAEEYFARAPALLDTAEKGPAPLAAEAAARLRELKVELAAPPTEAAANQLPAGFIEGSGAEDEQALFWVPKALARPVLGGGAAAVPLEAVRSLVKALRTDPDPLRAVARWRSVCTGASLEAFAWSLVRAFLAAGAVPEDAWALRGLVAFGGDRTCERLGQMALAWNEEAARERARAAVATLVEIGTDAALAALHRLPAQIGRGGLAADAWQGLAKAAHQRGLDPESLADRLADTLGLGPDGSRPLGPAPGRLQAALDEHVHLVLQDTSGRTLTRFPKGEPEDAAHVQAEGEWAALKASAPRLIADQVQRLERAMASARRWRAEDFQGLRGHPVLRAIARGLVWATGDVARPQLFTLDRGGVPVDARGAPVSIPEGPVWLAHPLQIEEGQRTEWQAVLAAAGRPQPFPQLDRPVHQLSAEEARARVTSRFAGRTVSAHKLATLVKRGWRLGSPDGAASAVRVLRKPVGSATALLAIAPGLPARTWVGAPAQSLGDVAWVEAGALGPVEASELLLDLQTLEESPGGSSSGGSRRAV